MGDGVWVKTKNTPLRLAYEAREGGKGGGVRFLYGTFSTSISNNTEPKHRKKTDSSLDKSPNWEVSQAIPASNTE
jgi:hypothetical protein